MKEYSKNDWLPTWESTVSGCKNKLSTVSTEELAAIKNRRDDFEKPTRPPYFVSAEDIWKEKRPYFIQIVSLQIYPIN